MPTIDARSARPDDLVAVARLRWRWLEENGGTPAVEKDEFVRSFVSWAGDHATTHRCLVLTRDDEVIGMAFLATVARVPSPRAFERASGDLQCVYVVPEARNAGHGGSLIDAVLGVAADLGFERVTVHSTERAIPAYQRRTFVTSPRLLHARPGEPPVPGPAVDRCR